MATCPAGHGSADDDYCDVCGERIDGASAATTGPAGTAGGGKPCPDCGTPAADRFCEECGYDFATGGGKPTQAPPPPPVSAPAPPPSPPVSAPTPPPFAPAQAPPPQPVPTQLLPSDSGPTGRLLAAPPAAPAAPGVTAWVAVVNADRDYYDAIVAEAGPDAAGIPFPPYAPERRIPLTGQQIRIGRRGSSSPGTPPEIDLREPPEDPGVSHIHAVLLARPDGGWTLVDPGSTNRTCLNGSTDPIPLNVEVPVGDGERIHVGAWTTITLRRGGAQ